MERHDSRFNRLYGIGAGLVLTLLLLPVFWFIPADAQPQPSMDSGRDREIDIRIQTFFETLKGGNSSLAFEEMLRSSPLGTHSTAAVLTDLRVEMDKLQQFGEIFHWEKYETKKIGEDVVIVRYILKYERYPVIWSFTFYRKPSVSIAIAPAWSVIDIRFDTNLL